MITAKRANENYKKLFNKHIKSIMIQINNKITNEYTTSNEVIYQFGGDDLYAKKQIYKTLKSILIGYKVILSRKNGCWGSIIIRW
jgi:anaerobic ribonucleoside-triphosphate reductase